MFHFKYIRLFWLKVFDIAEETREKFWRMKTYIVWYANIFFHNLKSFWEILVYLLYTRKMFITWLLENFSETIIFSNKNNFLWRVEMFDKRYMKPSKYDSLSYRHYTLIFCLLKIIKKLQKIRCFFPIIYLHNLRRKPNELELKVGAGEVRTEDREYSNNQANFCHHEHRVCGDDCFSVSKDSNLLYE